MLAWKKFRDSRSSCLNLWKYLDFLDHFKPFGRMCWELGLSCLSFYEDHFTIVA